MYRIPFILNGIYTTGIKNMTGTGDKSRLEGVKILEVGCGGGILCEVSIHLVISVIMIKVG